MSRMLPPYQTCTLEQVIVDAAGTANEWMISAIEGIDDQFGEGYAREHPELIAAYMKVAAMDQAAMISIRNTEASLHAAS